MTAHYARLTDTTVRRHWEAARKVNARGETVSLDPAGPLAEAAWAKQQLSRATQALPNGYCQLPVVKTCPHANSCLTCPMFLTTAEFLPQHHAQREQALQIITAAEANGRARLAEMNQQVAGKLKITLDQRITVRYQMKGMTACYICHHLEAALLTELPAGGSRIGGHRLVRLVTFPGHDRTGRLPPGSGRTGRCPNWRAAGDRGPWEPYQLVDRDGAIVGPVAEYLKDLQAAGRPAATQRSYAYDLLRWFRFCWAVDVHWSRRQAGPPGRR